MSDLPTLALALLAGGLLGGFYFGGLWWTVQKGLSSERPAFWFLGSVLLRISVVLAGFYLVARSHLASLIICLFGFVIARLIVVKRLTRAQADEQAQLEKETGIAP
ncbi:N-ATPase subunit AtpR [Singulisphaera rosea]